MKLNTCVTTVVFYLLSLVFAVYIRSNTTKTEPNLLFDNLNIAERAYLSIVNCMDVDLGHYVLNEGDLYVTNTNGVSVRMIGQDFQNHGIISFNSFLSQGDHSTYHIAPKAYFSNSGEMFFGISSAPDDISPFIVTSEAGWRNQGMMVFRKEVVSTASLILGASGERPSTIVNDGSICLYNTFWQTSTSILGDGCIKVDHGSILDLNFAGGHSVAKNQTFLLESPGSVFRITGVDEDLPSVPVIKVGGLGDGNAIDFDFSLNATRSFVYSLEKVSIMGLSESPLIKIEIGPGYVLESLVLSTGPIGSRLSYELPVPHGHVHVCRCQSEFPDIPETPIVPLSSCMA
ncbi:hypothetical protein METBIDRAFT_10716 [Metschnikowia bicuspidata var. bicuspidata NRRL YB-4993]|uniref:Hyphally-regulated cell wall protein N-terminal domain-containing protein n=1 Tax=Metschnikowia bicuspidata var. bicuspidata NRRL YB-4993 TaxID=869754 RepID=A0A1A0HD26_9ASCO|nr:hypothetical protein METBIDRAFT_10716 [Metschnikowia bicuspidata var. bicuspidata NRRL YB-4993]OBA21787.1 hypothetical protein METBIDRAFT_10716 [Metschnikowia bicuspidata var. bicuspidata NRRL YB-4993]